MARKKFSIEQQLEDARQEYIRIQQRIEDDKARLAKDTDALHASAKKVDDLESQLVSQYRHAANLSFEELIALLSDLVTEPQSTEQKTENGVTHEKENTYYC